MKTTWITIIAGCITFSVMAQEGLNSSPAIYELGISLGLNQWQTLDKNASPLPYKSTQKDLGLHFKYYRQHSLFTVGLRGAIGRIQPAGIAGRQVHFDEIDDGGNKTTISVPANGNLLSLKFDLGYRYIFNPENRRNQYGIGVTISDELYNPNGFTRPALMNIASVNPSVYYEHFFSADHQFHINASVPVYALVTRMPYDNTVSLPGKSPIEGLFSKGTVSSSWQNYKATDVSIGYKGRISESLKGGFDYIYQWKSIKEPKTLKMQNNVLLASFLYEF